LSASPFLAKTPSNITVPGIWRRILASRARSPQKRLFSRALAKTLIWIKSALWLRIYLHQAGRFHATAEISPNDFALDQRRHARCAVLSACKGEIDMPTATIIGVIAFAAPFVFFALTLAYGDYCASHRERSNRAPVE
jgi:hypothetical protein